MAKPALQHVCRECGFQTAKWFGKCSGCGAFGSVEEQRPAALRALSAVLPIDQVPLTTGRRDKTGIGELDRALGGGL
ncbi:MAG: DNA repair protein RadA, partial [Myxococcales bacterium]